MTPNLYGHVGPERCIEHGALAVDLVERPVEPDLSNLLSDVHGFLSALADQEANQCIQATAIRRA
jgi:hypothetical protein